MFDNCREAAFGAVKEWVLSVLLNKGGAASKQQDDDAPKGGVRMLGKPMRLKPGEAKGKERWRVTVSQNRLTKYCFENDEGFFHPLAGLLGYSE